MRLKRICLSSRTARKIPNVVGSSDEERQPDQVVAEGRPERRVDREDLVVVPDPTHSIVPIPPIPSQEVNDSPIDASAGNHTNAISSSDGIPHITTSTTLSAAA